MSPYDRSLPGNIRQLGHVVADLDAAITTWLTMGVGPWFILPTARREMSLRGASGAPEITIAFANSGELQIELIQQHDDTPSVYREFLDAGYQGLHHHAWWVDDYGSAAPRATDAGWHIVTSGDSGGLAQFCYLERPELPGVVVELMELNDLTRSFMDAIRDASVDWDGSNPVR
jgi:Glyoxalase/Bleomycin resistance protein/Dioxygenase superfamily